MNLMTMALRLALAAGVSLAACSPERAEVVDPADAATPAAPTPQEGRASAGAALPEASTVAPARDDVLTLAVGDTELTATLVDNSSVDALRDLLADGPLTIEMSDYGSMEKVGPIGTDLPRNDEQITTEAGDLILYQGGAFVIYYAPNSWSFTRLGKIDDVTGDELREILGPGDVSVTLSLPRA